MAHSDSESMSLEVEEESRTMAQLFDAARRDFEVETGLDLKQAMGLRETRSVDDLMQLIESNNDAFGQFRSHKHPTLIKHLKTILRVSRIADAVISGPVSNLQPASMLVFNAVNFLFSCIDEVSLTYDTVQAMFLKVESVMQDMDVLDREQLPPKLLPPLAELMRATVMLCALSKRLAKRGKFLTYVKGVLQGRDPAVAKQLLIIDRLRSDLSSRIGALTLGAALDTRETFTQVRQNLQRQTTMNAGFQSEVRASLNEIMGTLKTEDSEQKLRADIAKTLHPTSRHQAVFNSVRLARAKMSGTWILEDVRYRDWLECQTSVLWISGGPGTGKTSISTYIIQELQEHAMHRQTTDQRMMVGYFFFREGDSELRTGAMRTIGAALTEQSHLFLKFVDKLCLSRPELFEEDTLILHEVIAPFLEMVETPHVAYIVLDGLDEAEQSAMKACLEMLNAVLGRLQGKLQVLLVGRPELGVLIRQGFDKEIDEIRLSAATNATDIDLFIAERLPKLPHYKDLTASLRKQIREELARKSNGLFLWAQVMLKEIEPYYRPKKIRDILDAAPMAMVDLFQHVLRRLSNSLKGDDATDFNGILTCCTFAQRPFSIAEVQVLLKIMAGDDSADTIDVQSQVINHMSSFLVLNDADQIYVETIAGQRTSKSLRAVAADVYYDDEDPYLEAYESDSDDASSVYDSDAQVLTFIHTSCLQYFRVGANTKIGEVGIDINEAKVQVLEVLLTVLTEYEEIKKSLKATTKDGDENEDDNVEEEEAEDEKEVKEEDKTNGQTENATDNLSSKENDIPDLEDGLKGIFTYAANNWHLHLELVDLDAASVEFRTKVSASIVKLLTIEKNTEDWMGEVDGFPKIWLEYDMYRQLVCKWLQKDPTTSQSEDPKIKPLLDHHSLLDGARDILVKKWLSNTSQPWKASMVYEFLATYYTLVSLVDSSANGTVKILTKKPDAASIYAIANYYKTDKTIDWHIGVGYCFFHYSMHDEAHAAVQAMRETIKDDDLINVWRICLLESRVFWAERKYEAALGPKKRIIQIIEDTPGYLDKYKAPYWYNMMDLGSILERRADYRSALEIYTKVYKGDSDYYRNSSLWWMERLQRYFDLEDEQRRLFEELTAPEKDGLPRIVKNWSDIAEAGFYFMADFFEIARKMDKLDLIEDVMSTALAVAVKEKDVNKQLNVQYCQAWFLEQYQYKRKEAIELWRKMLLVSSHKIARRYIRDRHNWTVCQLGNAYADELLIHPEDEKLAQEYLNHLQQLKASENQSPSKSEHPAALLSAIIHFNRGNYDEYQKISLPFIKAGVELLSDTDDANDFNGYALIADACNPSHEDHLETAMWHMSWIQKNRSVEDEVINFSQCEACHNYILTYYGYYSCKQCFGVALCNRCWGQVRDGTLGYRICAAYHPQFVPKECPLFEQLEVSKVCFRGQLTPLADWLGVVKEDWGIKDKNRQPRT